MATDFQPTQVAGAEGIAIIGMACLFPGATDVDTFWSNILAKVDAVSDPPPGSWDPAVHYDPDSTDSDRIYAKRGGYIAHMATFDPLSHGIPPSAVGGEPDQWLALDIARRALEDAGYAELDKDIRRKTAVVLGRGALPNVGTLTAIQHGLMISQTLDVLKSLQPNLTPERLEDIRIALRASLPEFGPDTAPGFVPNLIVGRIANRLDLMGPNMTVDAACASSHVAIEIAINGLLRGTSDLALAGGSHIWTPVPMLALFSQLGALSRADRIRPFDKEADGTLLGEGLGMVVLKRLTDAERDGDRIYSVIRGVGVASDGRAIGVMAPRAEGEELAIRRAYEIAQVAPGTVELIEAHGTGTTVGDLVEIEALRDVLGERHTERPTIAIGSVKSNIGHLVPAAGVASIIKTSLALYHKVLPPTLNVDEPSPDFALERSPLYVNTEVRPWINGHDHPRRAGVSAFGFGGIDAHIVLEEYTGPGSVQRPVDHLPAWETETVLVTADSRADLVQRAAELGTQVAALAGRRAPPRLQDVAYSINQARSGDSDAVLAVVADSIADLAAKLGRAAERLADPACTRIKERSGIFFSGDPLARRGKVAFLFPGEGAQYENMLADLCLSLPVVRETFDAADRYFRSRNRAIVPSDFVFPRSVFTEEERRWAERQLWDMDNAVSAVLIADEALMRVLGGLGVRPDGVVGHSSGEFAALRAAGVLGDQTGDAEMGFYDMLAQVGRSLASDDGIAPAALLAIGSSREDVDALINNDSAWVAADNCHHQVVVATDPTRAAAIVTAAKERGMLAERLPFDRGYHTEQYAPLSARLQTAIRELGLREPAVTVYSCSTTRQVHEDLATVVADQFARPVEFRSTIERMHDEGYRVFIEVGPRGNLTGFVADILRGKDFSTAAIDQFRVSGVRQLNTAIAILAAEGVGLDVDYVHRHRNSRLIDFAAADVEAASSRAVLLDTGFPAMTLDDSTAEPLSPRPLPARPVPAATLSPGAVAPPPSGALASATTKFFETMDHFLAVQEQVMLQHLAALSGSETNGARVQPLDGHSPSASLSDPVDANDVVPAQVATRSARAVKVVPNSAAPLPVDAVGVDNAAGLLAILIEIVVERTGYPADVIGLDADLEADLGIDSIKRVEILTTLRRRVANDAAVDLQQLTTKRTLNEIIDALAAAWR